MKFFRVADPMSYRRLIVDFFFTARPGAAEHRVFRGLMLLLIALNMLCALWPASTLPLLSGEHLNSFANISYGIFLLEYLLRLLSAGAHPRWQTRRWPALSSLLHWPALADLCVLLPLFLVGSSIDLRWLKGVRALEMLGYFDAATSPTLSQPSRL